MAACIGTFRVPGTAPRKEGSRHREPCHRTPVSAAASPRQGVPEMTESTHDQQHPVAPVSMPRRQALSLLGASALAALTLLPGDDSPVSAARKHRRHHASGKNKKRNKQRRKRDRRRNRRRQNNPPATILFQDTFTEFNGSGSDWTYFSAPGFTGNDAQESTSAQGLLVSAPQFSVTVPQESGPTSHPGGFDHVKWLAYTNRLNGAVPGFAAPAGKDLIATANISARMFGVNGHPFGSAVSNPDLDGRLAAAAMNGADFESWLVFDHFITNKRLYAVYERLPFGRPQMGNYASFTFMIPLADRQPSHEHELSVVYNRSAGTVRWLVDGDEKFRVDRIGHLIDRKYMTLDHGGVEEDVSPKQLAFGMGLFTLLDGRLPGGQALVKLSTAPDFYFDPAVGQPKPQTFFDEQSADASRLFGQGGELRVRDFTVTTR